MNYDKVEKYMYLMLPHFTTKIKKIHKIKITSNMLIIKAFSNKKPH